MHHYTLNILDDLFDFDKNYRYREKVFCYVNLVDNDGKYPDKICPGCEIQLEATKLFFDLIIEGQNQLKLIFDKISETCQPAQLQNLQNIAAKVGTFEVHSIETGEKYFLQGEVVCF
ncbi:hypothetical protein HHI36_005926 [Cryptolaemus montrouzieri]|uniref:Uncharacterized protein n=1 Tax=Cryptolaemus montrouzieri TaxID=559131 RepID=A0ABD2NWI1_9CUCU